MAVDQSEILKEAFETLNADAALVALLGGTFVFNHVPQDHIQPYIALIWQANVNWDTKDSDGFDGSLNHEVVSTHHGDRDVLKIVDAIRAAYKAAPLVLASGRIVCFDYVSGSVPIQVLETHRAIASFKVLVDADGVGGVPIPDPVGGLIIVQDEGVDLANTPHKTLNFLGAGVSAADAGGDVADITIPSGGGATFKHRSNQWYGPVPNFNDTASGFSDEIQLIPVEIPETGNYKAVGLTAVSANGSVKFGVYDSADNGGPKNKLKDLGSTLIIAGGIGTIITVAPFSLAAGFVWIAALYSGFPSIHMIQRLPTVASGAWENLIGRISLQDSFQTGLSIFGSFAGGLPADISTLSPSQLSGAHHLNIQKA